MPELSRFGGMVIYMLFSDTKQHNKPHVRVYYGDYEASISLDGELLAVSISRKQLKMVVGWLLFHEEKAYAANTLKRSLRCEVQLCILKTISATRTVGMKRSA